MPKPPDVIAPRARALVSKGRPGPAIRLVALVEDDSGEVRSCLERWGEARGRSRA